MPPKGKFAREDIVEAAFEIAKAEGLSGITARSVAKRLGSSVAPVYVHFEAITDLVAAVVERVFALSRELAAEQKGANLFENIGKASLKFAKQYPALFRELLLQPNQHMNSYEAVEQEMAEALAEDDSMQGLTFEERRRLLLKMRVFQVGLSVMVANGHLPSWSDDRSAEALLKETGDDLIYAQQMKRRKNGQ